MPRTFRYLAVAAATVALAACGDSPTSTSPTPESSTIAPFAAAFDFSSQLTLQSTDFKVGANGGTYSVFGKYTVAFPANSICDPAISTYGPTQWDQPCTTLKSGSVVVIHAVLSMRDGNMSVDFSPALRFSPNTVVTVSTDNFALPIKLTRLFLAAHPSSLNTLAIYYSPSLTSARTFDFASDPSLITHVNLNTGIVWRRVKHFSGYLIGSGLACTPSPDLPECVEVDGDGSGSGSN